MNFFHHPRNIPGPGKAAIICFLIIVPQILLTFSAEAQAKPQFSHERGFYFQSFELKITANSGADIYYTLNCSMPNRENGIKYNGPVLIDSTLIVKAVFYLNNTMSEVLTHTYIFPEVSARQPKSPAGFPLTWGGAKIISADYEMDSAVVFHPDYAEHITKAFTSLPVLSLSMDTDEWFNHQSGLYVGYENTNITREKPVNAEFIFNNTEEKSFGVSCGVQNQGGTSIVKWKSPKQSMRLLFKEIYGDTRLNKRIFTDSDIESINTLVVDCMLNATWIHPAENQRQHSLYLRDQLTADLYKNMGNLSVHGRYFHLFLNGIYWGICNLHERPDDAFLSEYDEADRENFDVLKHGPDNVVSGTNAYYLKMLDIARNGFTSYESILRFNRYIDLPAFIDYMILNFYLGNFDWANKNYYVGRDRFSQEGFKYYPWDSEHVMRFANLDYNNTQKNNEGGPTEIHTHLRTNEEYRMMFADAVYRHFFNNGALAPENFEKSFLRRVNEIEKAIILESARWGDYRIADSNTTYTKADNWLPKVKEMLSEYIPYRRDVVLEQLKSSENLLFPKILPPQIAMETMEDNRKKIKLIPDSPVQGVIYYTLNGSDPRSVGGDASGIKYNNEIILDKTSKLKARFFSKGFGWSPLIERDFIFNDVYGSNLVISEIMYHPQDEYPEFIEIINSGETTVNLNGFAFVDGIEFVFSEDREIAPGIGFVLTNDNLLFNQVYEFNSWGQYDKKLSNGGEKIVFQNGFGQVVDSVSYSDTIPWPVEADGDGYSLELIDLKLDNAVYSSWRVGEEKNGSPFDADKKLDLEIALTPNPFSGNTKLNILSPGYTNTEFIVEVFSITGKKIFSEQYLNFGKYLPVNLGESPPGIYIFRIFQADQPGLNPIVIKGIKYD